ncbi:MAG: outer membrane beta-barrel protein [Nitrospinaceae bacterium]|nr:porin family protein [Nitrospinaceae bacterium]NIR55881.1 porin family protein [Nitrospinaceae bacterium]NIS86333.1 porin family protein [Nitrospinaceae bacterium]NIT83163.1 porin family protein [Nitrospinaceae bacterium]NIU45372.1 porin family protein [Nitrospinaceae bacterium]
MKRPTLLFIAGLILLSATPSWARDTYLSGNVGFIIRSDAKIAGESGKFDNDPGFAINGAIGAWLRKEIRIEGELGLHYNAGDRVPQNQDFNFSLITFMGNGYYDVPTKSPLKPYVGAGLGLGLARGSEDVSNTSDTDFVGVAQLMAGLGYQFRTNATFTFGYRYVITTDPDFILAEPGAFETEWTSHDFMLGARFKF